MTETAGVLGFQSFEASFPLNDLFLLSKIYLHWVGDWQQMPYLLKNKICFWISPPFYGKNVRHAGWREVILRAVYCNDQREPPWLQQWVLDRCSYSASLMLVYLLTKWWISYIHYQTCWGSGQSCVLSTQLQMERSCKSSFHAVYGIPKYSLSNLRKSSSVKTVPSGFFFSFFSAGLSFDFLPLFCVRTFGKNKKKNNIHCNLDQITKQFLNSPTTPLLFASTLLHFEMPPEKCEANIILKQVTGTAASTQVVFRAKKGSYFLITLIEIAIFILTQTFSETVAFFCPVSPWDN